MERTDNDKGINSCHVCGSADLEPSQDQKPHFTCRRCGAEVKVTHWIVHRSRNWPEVTYVTNTGKLEGRVLAFAMPEEGGWIPRFVGGGMTMIELAFAHRKLEQPEQGPEREGRLYITLRAIKDEKELKAVDAEVQGLLGRERDKDEARYLDYLANLIIAWEKEHESW